jgi:hypothetical protein
MSCSISVHFEKLISVYNVLSNNIVAKQFKRLENRSDQTKTKLLLDGLEKVVLISLLMLQEHEESLQQT